MDEASVAAILGDDSFLRVFSAVEVASIAERRWASYTRRHRKPPSLEDRIRDLAKGLRDHFYPDRLGGAPELLEFELLARQLVPLLPPP